MNMIAGLDDVPSKAGSFKLSIDRLVRLSVPKSFTAKDITKLRRDCEIFLERLKNDPKKLQNFMNLAASGNLSDAQVVASELRITEEDFEKEGGGWIVLLLIVVFLLLAHDAK